MADQYIVAVHLDGTLIVNACGPFRSRERADDVCERINTAGEWSDNDDSVLATISAQVVTLWSVEDMVTVAGNQP